MLKQTVHIISYLFLSLLIGIVVTLVTDGIENVTVAKRIRQTVERDIRSAITSFRESARRPTTNDVVTFVKKYVAAVLRDKVIAVEEGADAPPSRTAYTFLFTHALNGSKLNLFISNAYLQSELQLLDVPDAIAGLVATVISFTFLIVYAEKRKQSLAMQRRFEQRHAELRRALERHEALALMGRMSAALAHELKTPIATIANLIQVVPDRFSDETFRRRFVALVRDELMRTQQLIDNLLVYGKEITLNNEEWVLLGTIASQTGDSLGLTVTLEPGSDCALLGDPFYLGLLLKNLFRNSREAGADRITIRRESSDTGSDSPAVLTFEDNGNGFPGGEDLVELISPFVTSRSRGGGLGLYLANKIVAAHNGTLVLYRPRAGAGAGVRISFPKNRVRTDVERA